MQLNNKTILLTGASGYLGTHLHQALIAAGAKVYTIGRRSLGNDRHIIVDLNDKNTLRTTISVIRPQIIFHLAANINRDRSFDNHDEVMHVNYHGTVNLLKALEQVPYEHFIFTSSSEVYGNNKAPFRETQLPQPASPYSLSKACAEQAIETFSKIYKKHYTILRLFNFYGPLMPENFFIPQMMAAFSSGNEFKMTNGEQTRDFLFVEDVVNALILTASNRKSYDKIFNVCSNKAVTLKKIAKEVHEQMGSHSKIAFGAIPYRENEIWNMLGSNKKIRTELGFKQKYSLKKGIKQVIGKKK